MQKLFLRKVITNCIYSLKKCMPSYEPNSCFEYIMYRGLFGINIYNCKYIRNYLQFNGVTDNFFVRKENCCFIENSSKTLIRWRYSTETWYWRYVSKQWVTLTVQWHRQLEITGLEQQIAGHWLTTNVVSTLQGLAKYREKVVVVWSRMKRREKALLIEDFKH